MLDGTVIVVVLHGDLRSMDEAGRSVALKIQLLSKFYEEPNLWFERK
jgi:hypothetical protein